MATYPYETAVAVRALIELDNFEGDSRRAVLPLNALFGLQAIDAPIVHHFSDVEGEQVVISAGEGFQAFANSDVMDDVHIANEIRSNRSLSTRMAISAGVGRGITTDVVKAAWRASYKRTC